MLHHARVATRTFSAMRLIANARRSLSASTRSVLRAQEKEKIPPKPPNLKQKKTSTPHRYT
ncbi:hypothetical protein [Helicobacter felis]|uniref:hypothetical protein n=1 Tax=Helicobacter felis TaxID=214 RepID=UPI000CEDBB1C|nr:hypothetical protein [Helicobacter felis]